jgi:hypothetical protein
VDRKILAPENKSVIVNKRATEYCSRVTIGSIYVDESHKPALPFLLLSVLAYGPLPPVFPVADFSLKCFEHLT